MAFQDLREFLTDLEARGELVRINQDIATGHEVFTIMWELSETQGPAFVANQVAGYDIPVVGNIVGTLNRWALACDLPLNKSEAEYRDLFAEKMDQKKWVEPQMVATGPCKEVILKGDQIDLNKFPILQWHPVDGGRYITMPLVITKDDKFGLNAGMYRTMIHEPNLCTVMTSQVQDIGIHMGRAKKAGKESIPCAVVVGSDPSLYMAAVTKIPLKANEFAFASALRGGVAVEMVKCETIDLEVPAHAEIVIEGNLMVNQSRLEGPYCEWMGYAEEPMRLAEFQVTCITHRRDPLFLMTTEGHMESEGEKIRMIPQMSSFLRQCKERITGFSRAHLPACGRNYTAVVAINKRAPGWGKHAIMQAYSVPFVASSVNIIIVVDDDIDPANNEEVLWALSTRVDPERDVIIFPPAGVAPLNPAGRARQEVFADTGITDYTICSKMGIDATLKKFGADEGHYRPVAIPVRPDESTLEQVKANWEAYGFNKG